MIWDLFNVSVLILEICPLCRPQGEALTCAGLIDQPRNKRLTVMGLLTEHAAGPVRRNPAAHSVRGPALAACKPAALECALWHAPRKCIVISPAGLGVSAARAGKPAGPTSLHLQGRFRSSFIVLLESEVSQSDSCGFAIEIVSQTV